jgi:hypothetical protein
MTMFAQRIEKLKLAELSIRLTQVTPKYCGRKIAQQMSQ